CLGAATALLRMKKLDDAHARADSAVEVVADRDERATAHELLARIALARHDAEAAREHADLTRQADPRLPLPAFVDARLLFDQGSIDDALPRAEEAIQALERSHGRPIAD